MGGLILASAWVVVAAMPGCQPSDCLARLRALGSVEVVARPRADLAGAWSEGAGLAGVQLYLFSDSTYVHTRWSDVLPETVYDKGEWAIEAGVVTLTSDAEVVRDSGLDHQFLLLRVPRRTEPVLFGLNRDLPRLEGLVRAAPETPAEEWLSMSGMEFRGPWPRDGEAQAKAEILKRPWRHDLLGK